MSRIILILTLFLSFCIKAELNFSQYEVYKDAQFKKFFFKIYRLEILTANGGKVDFSQEHIFRFSYHRDITSDKLIEATLDDWDRLQLCRKDHANKWAIQLSKIWPDINQGDSLTAFFNGSDTRFYQKEKFLGSFEGKIFARAFFNIWLDTNSQMTSLHD